MTTQVLVTDAAQRIERHQENLIRGVWSEEATERVCALSALVDGAQTVNDCIAAGWPGWLAPLVVSSFDSDIGADDELAAATAWWRELVQAVSAPVDYYQAYHRYIATLLTSVVELDSAGVVQPLIDLHERSLAQDWPTEGDWLHAGDSAKAAAKRAGSDSEWNAARTAARTAGADATNLTWEATRHAAAALAGAARERASMQPLVAEKRSSEHSTTLDLWEAGQEAAGRAHSAARGAQRRDLLAAITEATRS